MPATSARKKRTCARLLDYGHNWKRRPSERRGYDAQVSQDYRRHVRRFLRAFIEGAALAKKDKAFATRVMAKYLATNEREVLTMLMRGLRRILNSADPSVEGIGVLLKTLEKNNQAREAKPEDFLDARLVRELDKTGFGPAQPIDSLAIGAPPFSRRAVLMRRTAQSLTPTIGATSWRNAQGESTNKT